MLDKEHMEERLIGKYRRKVVGELPTMEITEKGER